MNKYIIDHLSVLAVYFCFFFTVMILSPPDPIQSESVGNKPESISDFLKAVRCDSGELIQSVQHPLFCFLHFLLRLVNKQQITG